jgi:hypothetical protein
MYGTSEEMLEMYGTSEEMHATSHTSATSQTSATSHTSASSSPAKSSRNQAQLVSEVSISPTFPPPPSVSPPLSPLALSLCRHKIDDTEYQMEVDYEIDTHLIHTHMQDAERETHT